MTHCNLCGDTIDPNNSDSLIIHHGRTKITLCCNCAERLISECAINPMSERDCIDVEMYQPQMIFVSDR